MRRCQLDREERKFPARDNPLGQENQPKKTESKGNNDQLESNRGKKFGREGIVNCTHST